MATYVLVHGAWGGGWVYQGVARSMRAAGHDVYTPTLTGLGERAHLVGEGTPVGLSLHVQDIVAVLEVEDLSDVILCGHSYGGMVITGVAARAAERISSLFYLDAFLPRDGQSLLDLVPEPIKATMVEGARVDGGRVAPLHRRAVDDAGDAALQARRRRPQSLPCFTEGVQLTGAEAEIARRTYVYATENHPSSFTQFYDALCHDPAWRVATVATGHMVMLEDPQTLTNLLLAEAREGGRRRDQ